MQYISTRDKSKEIRASQGIIQGIAKDGGLFVPKEIPQIENLQSLINMDYKEIGYTIMSKFLSDFEPESLKNCIDRAYDGKFTGSDIAPLVEVDGVSFLELFHGPTFAFKDMALSILPYLLKEAMKINASGKEVVILTATSGDTGKAALEGFANVEGIKIIVFFPEDGVSEIQKLQMLTQEGDNAFVVSINGNFDDAQNGVKEIFNNKEFISRLDKKGYRLSSANSINIGRLIPQIVYYFYSYIQLVREGKIKENEKINFVVPTGNFGNILAAYYGKMMGLPVNKLICASNENNVLTEFINSGIYDRKRKLILTSSPSMDILISSNLERLLFHLTDENHDLIKQSMENLNEKGRYEIEGLNLEDFKGYFSTEEEVTRSINKVFENSNYLIDPHTAVAYNAYEKYKLETGDKTRTVIVSTASPFKFASKVASSIGIDIKGKDNFEIIEELGKKANLNIPENIRKLQDRRVIHKNNCSKLDMEKEIIKFLREGDRND